MKNSIAKTVAKRVLLLLLITLLILFTGAWHTVYRIVSEDNSRYAETVLNMFCDALSENSSREQVPVDVEHAGDIIRLGDYFCERCGADFVYVYTIDEEGSSVTYTAAAIAPGALEKNPGDNLVGRRVECELLPEELALWHGEVPVVRMTLDNNYGHEITTLRLVEDHYGNRMIAGVDISYETVIRRIITGFLVFAAVVTAVILILGWAMYFLLKKRISEPAQVISRSMQEYISDGKRSADKLEIRCNDEYAAIASAFNSMTDDIASYVEDITELTRAETNRRTEMDIAAGIQRGLLPAPGADSEECAIRANMVPAKDIGGDLYDYMALGDGRFLTVIADVSGKGVSAAMFMSVTLTLIRQFAKMGLKPSEILRRTNDALAGNNPEMLFVTAFVGIYDSGTRSYTYSNAGHNRPYVIGKELKTLDGAAGVILGLFENEEYVNETVRLQPGDTVLLYTDGITEAVNAERSFFGTAGLETALRQYRVSRSDNPVEYVFNTVRAFSGGAEQNDDITVLSLTVKNRVSLELDCDIREFAKIKQEILGLPVPRPTQLNLCLAAEEVFVNICEYAFDGTAPADEKIGFSMTVSNRIELRFTDGGIPFNPLENIAAAGEYDPDTQIGGLGRLLSFSLSDDAEYKYTEGKNILTLIKYFGEEET